MAVLRLPRALLPVVFFLAVAHPSGAQSCGAPPLLKDTLKAASQGSDLLAEIPTGFGRSAGSVGKGLQAARLAALGSELMCECGGSANGLACLQENIDKQFLCELYEASGLPDFTNPFSVMAVYFPPVGVPAALAYELYYGDQANPYCGSTGGPTGIFCCKYNPSQRTCHAGTSRDGGNCLGAVSPPNNPLLLGEAVVGSLGSGFSCDHIPECTYNNVGNPHPMFRSERLAQWFEDLAGVYAEKVYGGGRSACTADFALFIGCSGWLRLARGGEPYLALHNETQPPGATAGRFRMELLGSAAQRIMFAIPNGLGRYEHIAANIWTSQTKAAYIGSVNVTAELGNWLTPCGLELLQATLPNRWEMMAVPAPGEGPLSRDPSQGWRDGCLAGNAPGPITAVVTMKAQEATMTVTVSDPEIGQEDDDVNPLGVDWGDGTIKGELYDHSKTNVYTHTYAAPGKYTIRMGYINDAGLSALHRVSTP